MSAAHKRSWLETAAGVPRWMIALMFYFFGALTAVGFLKSDEPILLERHDDTSLVFHGRRVAHAELACTEPGVMPDGVSLYRTKARNWVLHTVRNGKGLARIFSREQEALDTLRGEVLNPQAQELRSRLLAQLKPEVID